MGPRQLTVWAESISCCFAGFFSPFLSEINACVPAYMCAQTQLHAIRGYCGSSRMCSSVIIRTLLCPIRRADRQWKHSIDNLHFIIKPITTWRGEGEKKEWNKDENKLQREEDKDLLLCIFWALSLNVTRAFKHILGTKCFSCCCFDLVV